jgi:hypothetical protein
VASAPTPWVRVVSVRWTAAGLLVVVIQFSF